MSGAGSPIGHDSHPNALRIYGTVLGVGVICALAIVTVYETTLPVIERNRMALTRRAVFAVLPRASSIEAFTYDPEMETIQPLHDDSDDGDSADREVMYAGFDESGAFVGVAIETSGMGYQDLIRLLYGYSFDEQAVIGIRVLESRETPGLGDGIEKDRDFLKNFERLDVRVHRDGSELANRIKYVKPGEKTDAWQIDGITGATISSRAVAEMLSGSTARWIPRLHGQQGAFTIPRKESR